MEQGKEYYAFISYKREDEKWAKWLQDKLEHYKFPENVFLLLFGTTNNINSWEPKQWEKLLNDLDNYLGYNKKVNVNTMSNDIEEDCQYLSGSPVATSEYLSNEKKDRIKKIEKTESENNQQNTKHKDRTHQIHQDGSLGLLFCEIPD